MLEFIYRSCFPYDRNYASRLSGTMLLKDRTGAAKKLVIFTELPELADENGNIDPGRLDPLLPWSDKLPELYRAPRR